MTTKETISEGVRPGTALLSDRYDAIFAECMALAETWRSKINTQLGDKSFHADQHRRSLLRAAAFARAADKARFNESLDNRALAAARGDQ